MEKKLVSIIFPCYREESNIAVTYHDLIKVIDTLDYKYNFEVIFVNDWSPDNSWKEISKLATEDKRVKWINFSRNYGKELALTAGLEYSLWDMVLTLDVDWQHPIDKIPLFIQKREEGFDIVYNKRPKIQWASLIKRLSSRAFYKFFNMISDFKLEPWTTDYRLLDRRVVNVFLRFREKNRLFRGIIDFIGYNRTVLVFDALPDKKGRRASYNYLKLYDLAINSITSFSLFPLKLVGYLWLLITFVSSVIFIIMIIDKLWIFNLWFTNLALVVVVNTILIGVVLMSLGLIALYIANIHQEVIWRPLYTVRDELNIEKL